MLKTKVAEDIKKNRTLVIMLLPAFIYFITFAYLPMTGIVLAFKNYSYKGGIYLSPWAGLENFRFLFISGTAFRITKNTILYNLVFLLVNNFLQISVAIVIAETAGKYFKKIAQSIMLLPYFISWVVVGAFVYNIFNYEYGTLNGILESLHMQPIDVYGTPSVWKYILVSFSAWKWVGYGSVIYLAAIMNIDVELYESADMDGASIYHKIKHITLPLLTPTIIILLLINLGRILRGDFEMFFQVIGNNGLLYNATDVIDTFVFRSLISSTDFGMPAAAAFYQSITSFLIIMLTNGFVKKINRDYALF